ncbi:hypothetical protein Q3G72_019822 [Acer saccharum]|nr:hypothetical protein Q3G72_019822 [Acer saccharum]
MEGQYPSEAALQAAQLSLRCLELDPRSRPSMKEVVEVLKEIEAQASHLHHEEWVGEIGVRFRTIGGNGIKVVFWGIFAPFLLFPVAIKILNPDGHQGFDEWQSEEGSLDKHLFRKKKVIHRDLKTSIILLDENYNVKLSGFGLAMRGPCDEESHINTTRIMGTYGYAAPDYVATGNIYLNSDVYGFGVVLLELLTGLRALDKTHPNGKQNLVEWLKPKLCQKKELRTIMDVRMKGQYTTTAAFQAAELTQKCLDSIPENRPSMKEVVEVLKEIEAMEEETNNSKV